MKNGQSFRFAFKQFVCMCVCVCRNGDAKKIESAMVKVCVKYENSSKISSISVDCFALAQLKITSIYCSQTLNHFYCYIIDTLYR